MENTYNILTVLLVTFVVAAVVIGFNSPGMDKVNERKRLRKEKEKQEEIDCYNYYQHSPYVITFSLVKWLRVHSGHGKSVFRIKDVNIINNDIELPLDSLHNVLTKLRYQFYITESQEIYFKTGVSSGTLYSAGLISSYSRNEADVNNLQYTFDMKNKAEYCEGIKVRDNQDCREWNQYELRPIKRAEKRKADK